MSIALAPFNFGFTRDTFGFLEAVGLKSAVGMELTGSAAALPCVDESESAKVLFHVRG